VSVDPEEVTGQRPVVYVSNTAGLNLNASFIVRFASRNKIEGVHP